MNNHASCLLVVMDMYSHVLRAGTYFFFNFVVKDKLVFASFCQGTVNIKEVLAVDSTYFLI